MVFRLEFLLSQLIDWFAHAFRLVPGGFPNPQGDLGAFYSWYTYAYLEIGECFPLGDLVFWIVQFLR